jgi:hypothetical protein
MFMKELGFLLLFAVFFHVIISLCIVYTKERCCQSSVNGDGCILGTPSAQVSV